jgi:WD40 repeat protein
VTEDTSRFVEQALFEAPPWCLVDGTADGEHVVVVDHSAHRDGIYVPELDSPNLPKRVHWDGDQGPVLDALVPFAPDGRLLRFSPDRRHVAYLALTEGQTKVRVGVDGGLGPEFDDFSEHVPPTLSPSGGRVAYAALVEGAWRMVVDHVPRLDLVPSTRLPRFDRRGDHVAFVAGTPPLGSPERVVVDDVAQREYDAIVAWEIGGPDKPFTLDSITFGPDGRLGYVAREGSHMFVVLDGVEGPRFDEIHPQIAFSPDGRQVAYPALRSGRMTCVVDGVEQESYDWVGRPVFSPDGARLMYAAGKGNGFVLVVDGTPEGDHLAEPPIGGYCFSPDGGRHAYGAVSRRDLRGERRRYVVDGVPGPEFDALDRIVFSPLGDRFTYAARKGPEMFAVVDGDPGPPFELIKGLSFSAAGHVAYASIVEGAACVILDGQAGPLFETLALALPPGHGDPPWEEYYEPDLYAFSPDGTHLAYTGTQRGGGARPVVDGDVGPVYETASFPAVDDSRAIFHGLRDGFVHRVRYDF